MEMSINGPPDPATKRDLSILRGCQELNRSRSSARAVVDLYLPALIGAFIITLVEMTEVVALVFALGSHHGSIRTGALGAIAGTAAVSVVALAFGAALVALPRSYLLWGSSIALIAFGLFLF